MDAPPEPRPSLRGSIHIGLCGSRPLSILHFCGGKGPEDEFVLQFGKESGPPSGLGNRAAQVRACGVKHVFD